MPRKKPVVVFVFGILNIVFGSLGAIYNFCCGAGLGGMYLLFRNFFQQMPAKDQDELVRLWRAFADNVPGLIPAFVAYLTVSLVLAIVEIVSGIGLVRIRSWARWLAACWAVLNILALACWVFYQVAVVNPGMQKAGPELEKKLQEFEKKQQQKGQQPPPRQRLDNLGGTGNPVVDVAMTALSSSLGFIYTGVVLVIMLLPNTGRAIAQYNRKDEDFAEPRQDDFYDDEYQRLRRPPDQPPDAPRPPES
jgi:hypothetical protein